MQLKIPVTAESASHRDNATEMTSTRAANSPRDAESPRLSGSSVSSARGGGRAKRIASAIMASPRAVAKGIGQSLSDIADEALDFIDGPQASAARASAGASDALAYENVMAKLEQLRQEKREKAAAQGGPMEALEA